MRWERLFDELEGYAEHVRLAERDALVADLREGEWAERSWLDSLAGAGAGVDAEIAVREVGTLVGRIQRANEQVIQVETAAAVHVVAAPAVLWVRGADRSPTLDRGSVSARLGWGPVFREAQEEGDTIRLTLADGFAVEGRVVAVGRDFVRIAPDSGRPRDVPTAALLLATFPR